MRRTVCHANAILLAVMAAYSCGRCAVPATPQTPFTLGKDTTLVDGPLNADGTVNYLQVVNELLSKDVTVENNAAIPLLKADANDDFIREKLPDICTELGIPVPGKDIGLLQILNSFAQAQSGGELTPELSAKIDQWDPAMRRKPWKPAEMPVVAAWLSSQDNGIRYIEEACKRTHFYLPLVSSKSPPTFQDALPPLTLVHEASNVLAARAMLRAGQGDLPGALEDLRRVRVLARLSTQQHELIVDLIGNAMERDAMRGYEGLATSGMWTKEQLNLVTKEINAYPPFPEPDDQTDTVEEYLDLDGVMQIVRGDGEHIFRDLAFEFDESKHVDLGDLPKAHWDELMKEMHRAAAAANKDSVGKTFAQKMDDYDQRIKDASAQKMPGNMLYETEGIPNGIPALEAFLKLRPGETVDDYSRRIGRWLASGDPGTGKRLTMVFEGSHVERELALLAVSLAQYRVAYAAYPADLKELGATAHDSFSGKDVIYRREGNGYVAYSVGFNLKDDQAKDDDMVVRAEK